MTAAVTARQATKNWKDAAGVNHSFDTAHFIPFAEAVAAYYDTLLSALDDAMVPTWTWTAPSPPAALA